MKAPELTDIAETWLRGMYPQAHIVREFSVSEYGGALIDVAAIIEDQIVAVEVKGDGDSPTRLALQGMMYSRVCRSIFLLASPDLKKRCDKHRPRGWGTLSVEPQDHYGWSQESGLWVRRDHDQKTGYGLASVALAAIPWTREYGVFSGELGWSVPKTKSDCIRAVAEHEPLPNIERAVCSVLRSRDWFPKSVSLPDTAAQTATSEQPLTAYERAVNAKMGAA